MLSPSTPKVIFLSTPSVRRATPQSIRPARMFAISIHALHEEGDELAIDVDPMALKISIHALCEEGDSGDRPFTREELEFLSTPSARRATTRAAATGSTEPISIHALHEEGDVKRSHLPGAGDNFYPRPPRGGRQQKQRENTLLLSHYTPPCTNCKEVSVKQAVKLHRYLHSRPLFQCEASRKTMCTVCSHWPDIKRSARCPVQTPGVVQRVRPWSGSCCPVGRTADCLRRGRSGQWNLSQCTPSGRVLATVTV